MPTQKHQLSRLFSNPYYVESEDKRGHDVHVTFRISKNYVNAIGKVMMHKEKFSWDTTANFYRWAVKHALEHLEVELGKDGLAQELQVMMRQAEAARYLSETNESIGWIEKIISENEKAVQKYMATKHTALADKTITEVWTIIDSLPDSDIKRYHAQLFREKFTGVVSRLIEERKKRVRVDIRPSRAVKAENAAEEREIERLNEMMERCNA